MRKSLNDIQHMVVQGKKYDNLSKELSPYYVYLNDSGHNVLCLIKSVMPEAEKAIADGGDINDYECPVPVRYVIEKGYEFVEHNNEKYILCDVPYKLPFGVYIDTKYYCY